MSVIDLLERPIYGVRQVDRILGLRPGTALRWIDGYSRRGREYPPVVRESKTGDELVTWGEFVEARLLSEYRDQGVPIVRLREVVQRLRDELGSKYPLATRRPYVLGRELVAEVQVEVDLEPELQLVVLRTDQYVLTERASRFFRSVHWDGVTGEATSFSPRDNSPSVKINPEISFGEPSVSATRTEVLAEEFRAGTSLLRLATLFDLPENQVEDALRYEGELAATG